MAQPGTLRLFSFNHRNTSLDERDALAFNAEQIREFLPRAAEELGGEHAVLSTCNRTEFYHWGDPDAAPWNDYWNRISSFKGIEPGTFSDPKRARGKKAARHLFRVSASLESLALGENEILGQVKDAHEFVLEVDFDTAALDQLFQLAVRAGKEIRTETALCEGSVSVSSVAVDLANKIFGSFENRNVTLVGAGETAETAAEHFQGAGASNFTVVNRSAERGDDLAEKFGGEYRPLDELEGALEEADVAVVATGAQEPIVTEPMMRSTMQTRRDDPVFIIDISNPRNVDPACGELGAVYLYNMNDLQQVVHDNLESRKEEIPAAESVIDHYVDQWSRWVRHERVTPTISTLARYFEQIRQKELSRHDGELSESERATLETFSEGLVKKLLHNPITNLRSAVENDSLSSEQIELVWSLYNLREFEEQSNEN